MAALEQWQEALAQNVASSSLPGFKKTEVSFSAITSDLTNIQQGQNSTSQVSGSMPEASSHINLTPGELNRSQNDFDFAIQGGGFFQVQLPNGQMAYTRDGQFHLGPDKTLLNNQGMQVQGESGPITFKSGMGPIAVNSDGVITQLDQTVGKLPAFSFADPSKLRRVGDTLLTPVDSTVTPVEVDHPQILNKYIESSNVSSLNEMVSLVDVSRAYDANQKVVQTADDNEDKAIQSLGNPIN